MTYGCKIMASLTLCGFLDHPVYVYDVGEAIKVRNRRKKGSWCMWRKRRQ